MVKKGWWPLWLGYQKAGKFVKMESAWQEESIMKAQNDHIPLSCDSFLNTNTQW